MKFFKNSGHSVTFKLMPFQEGKSMFSAKLLEVRFSLLFNFQCPSMHSAT